MGPLNIFDPIFFELKLGKSATGRSSDGVVTPSGVEVENLSILRPNLAEYSYKSGLITPLMMAKKKLTLSVVLKNPTFG